MDAAANNIANCNTDGYKRARATIHENPLGLPETKVTKVDTPGPLVFDPASEKGRELSNVDIAEEMVNMMIAERGFMANLKTIQAEDELLGSLINILS
jgi:flagellar hook protein FlgE